MIETYAATYDTPNDVGEYGVDLIHQDVERNEAGEELAREETSWEWHRGEPTVLVPWSDIDADQLLHSLGWRRTANWRRADLAGSPGWTAPVVRAVMPLAARRAEASKGWPKPEGARDADEAEVGRARRLQRRVGAVALADQGVAPAQRLTDSVGPPRDTHPVPEHRELSTMIVTEPTLAEQNRARTSAPRISNVAGAPGFQIKRVLSGYAYPRNGNLHNPTPRYTYHLLLDGRVVDVSARERHLRTAAKAPNARRDYSA